MARLAKLTRPSPAAAYPRERLFELLKVRLDSAPVVWVSGPPGSGKTTLVADYVARRRLQCLWYQLDRGDDDIASFFHYLTESVLPWVGEAPLPQFQPEFLGDLEAFARNYFREVFRRLDKPLLVLDNHHEVYTSGPLNGVLQQALGELPDDGALVVLSRNDPPAAFAGLRARGKLETLGWSELRLTLEECAGVAGVRGVSLPEESLHALYARTQGWAAGLVLMLQDWRRGEPPVERVGSALPTVIFDYLAEEIFTKLADTEREALLKLAYLPQITASMARSLGVDEPARLALAELARSEFLATVMLVEPEPISQLHPLLRDFLLARAEQTGSEPAILARKQRAAEVLCEYGHIEAAANLWMRLREWPRMRQLIGEQASTLLSQGRHQLLAAWIRSLPDCDSGADPHLLHWLAACRYPDAPREARDLYARAYRAFESQEQVDGALRLAALNGVLEAILHDSADDYAMLDPWIDKALHLTRNLSEWPNADLEGRLTCNLFMAVALRRPSHPQLHDWRARAQSCCQAQRDPNVRITMESTLAVLASWNGQFANAERMLQGLRQLLQRQDVTQVSATHIAQAEATHFMLCGDRARCLEAVQRGLEGAARNGIRLWNDTFLANALCGVLAEGDVEAAAAYLTAIDGKGLAGRRYDEFLRAYGSGWLASLRGDVFLAHQHVKTAVAMADAVGLHGFQILACLALAQVLMDGADPRGAERELGRAAHLMAGLNNRMFEFMACMCRARLAMLRGDSPALTEALQSGLAIARDRGLTYHMWWQPRVMALLMQRALEHGIEVEFVRRLVEQRDLCPEAPPYHLASWPWRYRIRAFGGFQLEVSTVAETAPAKRSRRPIELLKALVAAGGEGVKLQALADQLWPRVDSDYANQSLTTTLHRLRKLLGDERALLVQAGELTLNRRFVWCDTWAFETACSNAAVTASGSSEAPVLLAAGQQLLALYRGPLLATDHEAAWAEAPRKFRRSQFARVVAAIGQSLERLPDVEQAIDFYRRALEVEPAAQSVARLLAQALERAGQLAEAAELRVTLARPAP